MEQDFIKIVVLAGGSGTRFWPVSRVLKPKQFLSLNKGDSSSLIQMTLKRVNAFLNEKNPPLIVCNSSHIDLIKEQAPHSELILEPEGRNTAVSIGLAASRLEATSPQSVMVVLPADHLITNESKFIEVIRQGASLAKSNNKLITIGIEPTQPHTGYGYIKCGNQLQDNVYQVARFFEKPNSLRARRYLEEGNYLWNSGIFIWRSDVFLSEMKKFMPETYNFLEKARSYIAKEDSLGPFIDEFLRLEPLSVDFGILEHSKECFVIKVENLGWNDLGSWETWSQYYDIDENGNKKDGDTLFIDSSNCIVKGGSKLIALMGVDDLIVIEGEDSILVCKRDRAQEVGKIVSKLKEIKKNNLI